MKISNIFSALCGRKKRLVIVGNAKNVTSGPIQSEQTSDFLNQFIDQSDIIIRMNDVKNVDSEGIGSRTDILAIMNTGQRKYLREKQFPQLILTNLKEILFVVPSKEIEKLSFQKSENPNCGIQFADKILKHQGWDKMPVTYTDDNQMLQLQETLSSMSGRSCMPSTGIRVIEHVLNQLRFHDYKVYLVGFGFEGWLGHGFDAEKLYVQELLDRDKLRVPVQATRHNSVIGVIRNCFSHGS